MSEALTVSEQTQLAECETVISNNIKSFRETGEALMKIRDSRLYRSEFKTFEEYCHQRWNFERSQAYRFIESAQVIKDLSPMGDIPTSERQARPLVKIAPQKRAEVWEEAVKTAPAGKVTAKHVEETVKRHVPPKPQAEKKIEKKEPQYISEMRTLIENVYKTTRKSSVVIDYLDVQQKIASLKELFLRHFGG